MAEISVVKYIKMLNKNLFPDNAFYKLSKKDDGNVKTIEIPEAGSKPTAKVGDYPSLPLTITKRTDSVTSYTTDDPDRFQLKMYFSSGGKLSQDPADVFKSSLPKMTYFFVFRIEIQRIAQVYATHNFV